MGRGASELEGNNLRRFALCLVLAAFSVAAGFALSVPGAASDVSPLVLRYSILDYPFAVYAGKTVNSTVSDPDADLGFFRGMGYSSMAQSMQIYTGLNESAAWGINQIPLFNSRPVLATASQIVLMSLYDFAVFALPLPYINQGWLHEEWHRAVMVSSYVNSYNPFTFFKRDDASGGGNYTVSYVLDENLELMKAGDNANFVRMSAAGGEAQLAAVARMQRDDFFYRRRVPQSVNYVLNSLNVMDYLSLCSNKELVTARSLEQIEKEGANQEFRDAKGFDFTAWAYDLFNPDVPYSARGLNPYGNGYDRYIYGDKLTDDQYAWLAKQSRLAFVNYFSPMNLFISGIPLRRTGDGDDIRGNFALRYSPTSFGNVLGLELFYQSSAVNLRVGLHLNQNYEHGFPGIEVELFEKPIPVADRVLLATIHLVADLQPRDQGFFTSEMSFAGLLGTTLALQVGKNFYPYLAVEGKTEGWMRGNEFLEEKISVELGLSTRFGLE
jgi:hypothetical protein